MPAGRPPKYSSAEQMQQAIDAYFAKCEQGRIITVIRKGQPIEITQRIPKTMAGLALALGFESRVSLLNYRDSSEEFMSVIVRARSQIEQENVECGLLGEHESRIASLNLASNFGYAAKTETDIKINRLEDILRTLDDKPSSESKE